MKKSTSKRTKNEKPADNGIAKFTTSAESELTEMLRALKDYVHDKNQESLHRLRVRLKKTNAVMTIMRAAGIEKQIEKESKTLKRLFGRAGNARELFIEREILRSIELDEIAIDFDLAVKQKKSETDLRNYIKKESKSISKACKNIISHSRKVDIEAISNELTELQISLGNILRNRPPTYQWHDIRKIIKLILYSRKWIDSTQSDQIIKYDIGGLKQLESAIGHWHDIEAVLSRINRTRILEFKNGMTKEMAYDICDSALEGAAISVHHKMRSLQ
jgi:CHAD domain-containing protein